MQVSRGVKYGFYLIGSIQENPGAVAMGSTVPPA
ncbi:hypothetical protein QOZ95_003818 [Paenibacillus brasilensis]|uniref:Uncharacterized protein n=1 Tax=Paenibacillus brasilensis TaxID=128574 RepID=A0ABU0L1T4_9BACL|nr:hypothetical protein [Paenibacillus brasilensis]